MGVVVEPLEVGAMYRSSPSKNPFEEVPRVRVLAIKDGFVKYRIGGTMTSSLPEESFRYCYPIKEQK